MFGSYLGRCFVLLCGGIGTEHAEYVVQSIANSHGILYVYPLVVMINSRPIPALFTPGIFTPSRRVIKHKVWEIGNSDYALRCLSGYQMDGYIRALG